mmetsp:Transcript_45872/g.60805  ORF Transcript_45872/g.60805 Transcript_45872/m.60805 type:complete len:240 (+) Transcript_45872:759-1478(+)
MFATSCARRPPISSSSSMTPSGTTPSTGMTSSKTATPTTSSSTTTTIRLGTPRVAPSRVSARSTRTTWPCSVATSTKCGLVSGLWLPTPAPSGSTTSTTASRPARTPATGLSAPSLTCLRPTVSTWTVPPTCRALTAPTCSTSPATACARPTRPNTVRKISTRLASACSRPTTRPWTPTSCGPTATRSSRAGATSGPSTLAGSSPRETRPRSRPRQSFRTEQSLRRTFDSSNLSKHSYC